jgi:hypothetical protein
LLPAGKQNHKGKQIAASTLFIFIPTHYIILSFQYKEGWGCRVLCIDYKSINTNHEFTEP